MSTHDVSRTILLIEDEPALSSVMSRFLHHAGYKTVVKHTGVAAIDYAATHTPDAVITDVHLPDINGLVLTQKLHERFGDTVPIFVLSGDTSMEVLRTLPHVGATHFFNKPVNHDLLIKHLATFFESNPVEKKPVIAAPPAL